MWTSVTNSKWSKIKKQYAPVNLLTGPDWLWSGFTNLSLFKILKIKKICFENLTQSTEVWLIY